MSSKKARKLPYQRRKAVIFFLIPLIQSLRYSFCEVKVNPGSLETEFAGLKKYIYALNEDQYYTEYLKIALLGNAVENSADTDILAFLFLAALQNIPPSAKEAAQMEGATSWEYFWKITFPYVSPFILANLIFTVIDSFTSPMNTVMGRILDYEGGSWKFG